jgi:hypothetical protein
MGTYLNAYIEHDSSSESLPFSQWEQIESLTEGSFSFHWAYDVFDSLAFGRSCLYSEEMRADRLQPLYPARGMPTPCNLAVAQDYFSLITDQAKAADPHFWPESGCVSREVADQWVREESSHFAVIHQWFNCPSGGTQWQMVSKPGNYNASWLLLREFDAALEHYGLHVDSIPIEFRIVRSAMELLTKEYGHDRVRLTLWFCS